MKTLYLDCPNGISGDMFLGAMFDLGIDATQLLEKLNSLNIKGWELKVSRSNKNGIGCTKVDVINEESHPHRGLSEIISIISASSLSINEKELATTIFTRLASAEAKVHGMNIEEIHFHEVGAVDAIIDICGASISICQLGVEKIVISPLPLGQGTIQCMHGIIPVPAPATLELLKGFPVYSNGMNGELVTPTGAAIVTTMAEDFGPCPNMTITNIGYGAGTKEFSIPNMVRAILGTEIITPIADKDDVLLLQANIDDMVPEYFDTLMDTLFEKNALDVWFTPIHMKKNRPGILLNVLSKDNHQDELVNAIFKNSTTFGIRVQNMQRYILDRKIISVQTEYGDVNVKIGTYQNEIVTFSPEYDDCKRIGKEQNLPPRIVYDAAKAHWLRR